MSTVKQLDVFGDSWPAGGELQHGDQYRFPDLLGILLNIKIANHAESATSIDQAVYQFINQYQHWNDGEHAVLFCLTDQARAMYFDQVRDREIHPAYSNHPPSTAYYKHIYTDKLGQFNQLKNILLVQELCRKKQIPIFFVCNWAEPIKHDHVEPQNFYPQSLFEILGLTNPGTESSTNFFRDSNKQLKDCKYIMPNQCHPNIAGHELIAKTLSIWIKEKI